MSSIATITVVGSVAGSLISANNMKGPAAAPYTPVNVGQQETAALQANQNNLGANEQLSAQTNTFNQSQANSMMEQALPGWQKLQSSLMNTTQNLLTNPYQLPSDVQQNLERQAAEQGVSSGARGQFNQFSLLRDLGVNELQYGQSRISQAQGLSSFLAGSAPRVNPMSPMSMFVSPQEAIQQQQYTNTQQQSIAQGYNNSQAQLNNYKTQMVNNSFQSAMGMIGGMAANGAFTPAAPAAPAAPQTPVGGWQDTTTIGPATTWT